MLEIAGVTQNEGASLHAHTCKYTHVYTHVHMHTRALTHLFPQLQPVPSQGQAELLGDLLQSVSFLLCVGVQG